MTELERPPLIPPDGHKKVLPHSCCAPCSGEVMEAMTASGIDISKREQFCSQEYRGCVYSFRDTNAHRVSQGRGEIEI